MSSSGCRNRLDALLVSFARVARRGGWYPAGAHTRAVSAALRLPCDARSEVAPRNSLRSLRSLRSNSRGESDHEARGYARRARCCDARRPPNRTHRVPPTAQNRPLCSSTNTTSAALARGRYPVGANVARREAQCGEGKSDDAGIGPARSREVRGAFSAANGGTAAALAARASQRTPREGAGRDSLSPGGVPPSGLARSRQAHSANTTRLQ
jgi:hypothetical protein